ncbi:TIGR04283 family arsenosugar biosynthesis glycosyltransferase [Catalinimonas niigatensis]|uniref:TIGR04283 family arsenosugar biosynthesis glycosyltransferase n=1 Tax=Catalinimonas niigatensis TaxID=1397264 RepID=UPI0026656C6D|nr:TIGR04283 family arsenosugar biosynthesis glycosyltransferase [Catalinimonas niigatensis]WPP52776.1 TIGR04283 family arsenosugar biosynthesis glycosyltransferase [Catalinimonas niigatensis]
MNVSVIIPTFNEEGSIGKLVKYLLYHASDRLEEIIVCDGHSSDATFSIAQQAGAKVILSPQRGRAAQMNYGASTAKGDILYFVHADTLPPSSYLSDIHQALDEGCLLGSYRSEFISKNPLLKINAYFTRFDGVPYHGGDQTLFIYKDFFDELGGYREDYLIMEDFEMIRRARQKAVFKNMRKKVRISARKYQKNSYLRVSVANFIIYNMFRMGFSPQIMRTTYYKLIKHPKAQLEEESSSHLRVY